MYTAHHSAFPLTQPCTLLSSSVLNKLKSLGKDYPKELLEKYGMIQGIVGDFAVCSFPMGNDSWHSINYEHYPKEPRFINAHIQKGKKAKLGLLGLNVFNKESEMVYLTEGIWDMLTLAQHDYPVLGLPGVNNFKEDWLSIFNNKIVYILFDNDVPGKKFAEEHGRKIATIAKEVKILSLPETIKYKNKDYKIKDISDLFKISSKAANDFIENLIQTTLAIVINVKDRITSVMIGEGTNVQKSMIIAEIILRDIEQQTGALLPFNNEQEFAVVIDGKHILIDEGINTYLSKQYGYIPSDPMWRYIRDRLYNYSLQRTGVDVRLYSAFKEGRCYIGIKGRGLLIIDEKKKEVMLQGDNGVFIKSSNAFSDEALELMCSKKTIKSDSTMKTLEDIFSLFVYDQEVETEVQKFQLKVWFYYTFFNANIRPALCITGPPGCGKTLLQKMLKGLLFGFHGGIYNPNSMPEEDYVLTYMLKDYKYLFLDEVNESDPRIKSKLRMLVTGEETVFRPKYERRSIRFRPNVWLVISAHSPKFRESDISQRLSIIQLAQPENSKLIKESAFFHHMEDCRPMIWRSIVDELQKIIGNLNKHKDEIIPLSNYCRQIDMANFAWAAFPEQRELALKSFNVMDHVQSSFSAELDPLLDIFDIWYEDNSATYTNGNGHVVVTAKQLYNDMLPIVRDRHIKAFPVSIKGLSKWISNRTKILEEQYGFQRERDTKKNAFNYMFKIPEKEIF